MTTPPDLHEEKEATSPDAHVEQVWQSFWKSIVCNPDGTLNVEQVKKELADYYHAIENVPAVYCHVTGNRLSKINYHSRTVIGEHDDYQQRLWDEREAELRRELAVELTALKDAYAKLEADAAMMREALKPFGSGIDYLPWGKIKAQIQDVPTAKRLTGFNYAADAALATDSGKNLLESVKKLEERLQNIKSCVEKPSTEFSDTNKVSIVHTEVLQALQPEQGSEVGITPSTPQA